MSSQSFDLEALQQRLGNLEKQNRWYKGVIAAVGIAFCMTLFLAADNPQKTTTEGEKIVLFDRAGNKRVELNGNGPYVKFYDDKGGTRAELFDDHLKFFDGNQKVRAEFFASHLKINDDSGVTRSELFGDHLKFFDEKRTERAGLFGDHFNFFDSKHQTLAELNTFGGKPSLSLFQDEKPVYKAP